MKKSKIAGLILANPIFSLKKGMREVQERYYANKCKNTYGVSQLPTIDIMDLFDGFDETIKNYTYLNGTSSVMDLMLLKRLARNYEACTYMEIGSWRGESISNVADVAKKCVSVSLSAKEMLAMGFDQKFVDVHAIFYKDYPNVEKVEANSHHFDFGSLNEQFDLIFVDGDHSYEGVENDTRKVFPLRKDSKSVIVWHDYGYNSEDVRASVLCGILDGIPKEKHKNLYHVSNTMCAVYIEDLNIPTSKTVFPTFLNKTFNVTVKAERFQK